MVKPWLLGAAGLLMTSAVAVAQNAPIASSTTTTTVQTNPAPVYQTVPVYPAPTTTTTRVDRSASQEDGMLTERTRTTQQVTPQIIVPPTTQTTTVERTVTVQPQ
jgi:hypothetical protein